MKQLEAESWALPVMLAEEAHSVTSSYGAASVLSYCTTDNLDQEASCDGNPPGSVPGQECP
jgi:hypothetical protein